MRIFYLCQRVPYPPDRGDRIPVFHQIRRLSRNHEVVVGSLSHGGSHANARMLEKELAVRVIAPAHSRFRSAIEMALAFLQGKPLSLGYFHNSALRAAVNAELRNRHYDAIIVFSSSMAQYVEHIADVPRIMHFCDVDSQKWSSMAREAHGVLRWIYGRESRLMLKFERRIAGSFEASCVVSHNEADVFRKHIPGIPVHILENGVDIDFFAAVPRSPEGVRIVFVGVMDYPPNVEAVSFFATSVWNRIRAAHPEARFIIVGSRPVKKVRALAGIPGVEVTGYVSDVRTYLSSAAVSIAPLAIARGVQNKILEAMAAGVPVLTTPAAAEGLPEGAAQHVIVAGREPDSFAAALLEMLSNRTAMEEMGRKGQEFIRQNCTWEVKLRALDTLLQTITGDSKLSRTQETGS